MFIRRELIVTIDGGGCACVSLQEGEPMYARMNGNAIALGAESMPRGSVLAAFVLVGRDLCVAENGGAEFRRIAQAGMVRAGLKVIRVTMRKRVHWMRIAHGMGIAVACLGLSLGIVCTNRYCLSPSGVASPTGQSHAISHAYAADRRQSRSSSRLDRLLDLDEASGAEYAEELLIDVEASDGSGALAATGMYERFDEGRRLFDAGEYGEALAHLREVKERARELPESPSFMPALDALIKQSLRNVAQQHEPIKFRANALIERARSGEQAQAMPLIKEARAILNEAREGASEDPSLNAIQRDLHGVEHAYAQRMLAHARAVERYEGCDAAIEAYRRVIDGCDGTTAVAEARRAMQRCGKDGTNDGDA